MMWFARDFITSKEVCCEAACYKTLETCWMKILAVPIVATQTQHVDVQLLVRSLTSNSGANTISLGMDQD